MRLAPGAVLPDRFLISLSKDSLGRGAMQVVINIAKRLSAPQDFLDAIVQHLSSARFVHFGFEQEQSAGLYKVYLESQLAPAASSSGKPVLLHRAFKWDVDRPDRRVVTQYVWHPGLSAGAIEGRLAEIYQALPQPLEIARGILHLAAARAAVRYLEVTEDGNPRRSFDLNLYDCGLQLHDINEHVQGMCRCYGIQPAQIEPLYRRMEWAALGHLAGGIHRQGGDFFTIYYGVEGRGG